MGQPVSTPVGTGASVVESPKIPSRQGSMTLGGPGALGVPPLAAAPSGGRSGSSSGSSSPSSGAPALTSFVVAGPFPTFTRTIDDTGGAGRDSNPLTDGSGLPTTTAASGADASFDNISLSSLMAAPIVVTQQNNTPRGRMLATLRKSWEILSMSCVPSTCIRMFYAKLLQRGDDNLRRLFAHTDLDRQSAMLRSVVTWLMTDSLDEEGIKRIAVLHVHLGVTDAQITVFRDCFIETIQEACGVAWTPEFHAAWTTAFESLVEAMKPTMDYTRDSIGKLTRVGTEMEGSTTANQTENAARDILAAVHATSKVTTQNLVYEVRASMQGKVGFRSRRADSSRDFASPIVRYAELRGRLLYILRMVDNHTASDVVRRVIDLARVTSVTSEPLSEKIIDANSIDALAPTQRSTVLADAPPIPTPGPPSASASAEGSTTMPPPPTTKAIAIFEIVVHEQPNMIHKFLIMGETDHEKWIAALKRAMRQFSSSIPAPTAEQVNIDGIFSDILRFQPTDFDMLTLLGRGSFGKVVKVQHKQSGKIYALKVINKIRFESVKNIIEVRRERAILEQIRHPFIVRYHGMFQTQARLYFLFDFLSGGELFYHTQQAPGHHFDESACRFYLAEMALAVEHLRVNNIIHRDIKGNNFVLDEEGHVVLTDFGFAKHNDDRKKNKSTCGTLAYIAPEVIAPTAMGYGHEVDWWGLGVVMFTMLTGFFPFLRAKPNLTARAIACDPLRFPKEPALSPEAQDLCSKLLTKKPSDRISSLEQLARHPFYNGWDWAATLDRRVPPPFVPDRRGSNTRYFSPKFTQDVQAVANAAGLDNTDKGECSERSQDVFGSYYDNAEGRASDVDDDEDSEMRTSSSGGRL